MAWAELTGSRREVDNFPSTMDYYITFTGGSGDTRPAAGAVYTDIVAAGDALPSTGLKGEPKAINVSKVVATTNKRHVTVHFQNHYTV